MSFDNRAKHHRLRALFPTRRKGVTAHAESAFDVVERDSVFGPESPWHGTAHVTFPQQRFVDVSDGEGGLAVLNPGLREYEITQDEDRAVALTLMRAYEVSLSTVSKCWEQLPDMMLAQAQGAHDFTYRIYPHAGDWVEGGVMAEADAFCAPMEVAQAGAHAGDQPKSKGFLEVSPANLAVSALKQAEDGNGWILRLFNPTEKPIEGTIRLEEGIASASLVRLDEQEAEKLVPEANTVHIEAGPKKIVTMLLRWEN